MEEAGASSIGSQILLIIILTLINAYLAGAEMAYVSVDQNKMKELADEGDKRAVKVLKLLDQSDAFLSTIQVGITFAGFFSSASAATTFTGYIEPLLGSIPGARTIANAIVTLALSYVSLVFGELFPKQVALQFSESYCLRTATVITFLKKLFMPIVWLLTVSTNFLKKITPVDFSKKEEKLTREEMKAIIDSGRNEGAIDMDEYRMMEGVLSLDDTLAKEVMVPRTDTFMIDVNDDDYENMNAILESPYSRVPVYDNDKDNIIGIVHSKDILREANRVGFDKIDVDNIVKPAFIVPETIYIDDLLIQFKRDNQHMAILKDEYGGFVGIVTMEDLIEEIVGNIEDEYDIETEDYEKINDTTYLVEGTYPVDKFNHLFHTDIEPEESDTIAGYMIEVLGHFPDDHVQESIRVGDYVLTTTEVENGRIRQLEVVNDPLADENEDDEADNK